MVNTLEFQTVVCIWYSVRKVVLRPKSAEHIFCRAWQNKILKVYMDFPRFPSFGRRHKNVCTYPSMFKNCLRVMWCSSTCAEDQAQNQARQNFCWAWINAQGIGILPGLMLCSKTNAVLDAGPAQLVQLRCLTYALWSLLTGRIKIFILYSHKFCRTKLPRPKRWGNGRLFWPCVHSASVADR